jgi:hypothetical protein
VVTKVDRVVWAEQGIPVLPTTVKARVWKVVILEEVEALAQEILTDPGKI